MIPQTQTSISPGLQALMVLKQQSNPTAPGPGGQPIPTVAAQAAQQAEQSQMPPTSPQGGIAGVARNTATGNAIEMQQQQAAQKALMDQMLAQQQAKTQQPPMMAEGGIASLYAGNMDDFAEGGVVGFAEGGQPKRAIERLWDWLQSVDEESQKARWKSAAPQETQQPMVPMIPNKGLEEPAATNLSVLPSAGYNFPSSVLQAASSKAEQKPAATGIASGRGANIPSIPGMINEALIPQTTALAGYTAPEQKTEQQLEEERRMVRARRGLPEQALAVEEQGLAELRKQNEAIRAFKQAELARQEAALGTPGEQSMNRFMAALRYGGQGGKGSFAQGLENARLAEESGIAGRRKAQLEMLESGKTEAIEYTRIQALITAAREAEAKGDMATAQKLADEAREAANKIVMTRAEGAKTAIAPAIGAFSGMTQQQMQAASAERLASLRADGATAKSIYDTVNDNVEKQMTAWKQQSSNKWANPAEVAAQRDRFVAEQITLAKQMGHRITPDMEALIKKPSAAPGTRDNPIKLD